jgi:hypothetical protein
LNVEKIGIGTSSPIGNLHVSDTGTTEPTIYITNANSSEGEIAIPSTEAFDMGHYDGTTFTPRMGFDGTGDFKIGGLATSVVRKIYVHRDGSDYTTTADGINKISDVVSFTPVSSTSTVYAIVNVYGRVENDGSDNDFAGRIEASSTQTDGTKISALGESINITDHGDVLYGMYNINSGSGTLEFHTSFTGTVAKNSAGTYSVTIFGGEATDSTSGFSTELQMRAMNVMFIEVEA